MQRTLVCLLLLSAAVYGQRYSFKRYDQSSGLPGQSVRCLLQDRQGFLWIGTDNALYRYDGRRYRTYGAGDGMPAARIDSLHQGVDGTLWIVSSAGLMRSRGERFEAVGLPAGKSVFAVETDSQGRVYVGGAAGLMVSGTNAGAAAKVDLRLYPNPGSTSQVARSVMVSASGLVWYGCGRNICQWRGGKVVPPPESGIPDDLWEAIAEDSHGNIWARSRTELLELPKGESRFRRMDADLPPASTAGKLLFGRDGELWVPTVRGLARRTASGWDIVGKSSGLPISSVECVLEDREGSIWIGLNGAGLVRWLGFPHWETFTEAEGLSSESVWGIYRDGTGVLWSINDVGLNRFNEATRRWEELKLPGLPAAQTTAIAASPDGSLWVGQVTGALRIQPGRRGFLPFGRKSGLTNPWITTAAVQRSGQVWIGTPNGLFHNTAHGFEREKLPAEKVPDFTLTSLADRKGRLWVGTAAGLLRLEAGQWTRITTRDGLLHDNISHLGEAPDGSVWIGYRESVGVSQLTLAEGGRAKFRHFSRKDGLQSEKCYFIGSDSRGWVWVGTDSGIDVFNGRNFRHLDHTDGLAWDDTNGNAFWADSDGSVWIGTARGISHVRVPPEGLPRRPEIAGVLLTSAAFGGQEVKLDAGATVPWAKRSLRVGFAAMTFVNEETVQFRYRIAGLEDRWSETQLGEVFLPSLPSGRYTFEVQAGKKAPARFAFTIAPAWWRARWFNTLAVLALAALAWQVWAWRVRAILRRQRELEDAVADRTRKLELEKLHAETQNVEIERLFQESQQAVRLKDQFLANMGHELKTPMNGIIGTTALALDMPLTADHRELWETVRSSGDGLVGIVDDILDFSKMKDGELEWKPSIFELHDVVKAAFASVERRAGQKHLATRCEIAPGVPRRVVGDPARVRQVLVNLLKNAVKFTDRGQVTLRLEHREGEFHFEVADTGIGIPREMQGVIFEAFSQADGSLTRKHGGTGLGLTICARLAEMMQGSIRVESEPGKGSRFHFSARLEVAPAVKSVEAGMSLRNLAIAVEGESSPPGAPLHILLAEDNPVNQRIAVRLLEKRGHKVVTAANGKEAVAAFERQSFDSILMDVQMPEMDGFEATAEVRSRELLTGTHITIIALTTHTLPGDRERCLQAGMDDYVAKPIRPDELFATLERRRMASVV